MTLKIEGQAASVNPLDDLGSNPDECLTRLIFGANVQYIGSDLLAALKSVAVKAAAERQQVTVRDLVDAWVESPDAAINGVRDVADAVAHAYLPS